MRHERLGDLLLEQGALDGADLGRALAHHRQKAIPLGRALLELEACTGEVLCAALSRQAGLPSIDLDRVELDPACAKLLPRELAILHRMVPFGSGREVVRIAIAAPAHRSSLEVAGRSSRRERVAAYVAPDDAIDRAIERLYGTRPAGDVAAAGLLPLAFEDAPGDRVATRVDCATALTFHELPEPELEALRLELARAGIPSRMRGADERAPGSEHDVTVLTVPALRRLRAHGWDGTKVLALLRGGEELQAAWRLGARVVLLPRAPLKPDERIPAPDADRLERALAHVGLRRPART